VTEARTDSQNSKSKLQEKGRLVGPRQQSSIKSQRSLVLSSNRRCRLAERDQLAEQHERQVIGVVGGTQLGDLLVTEQISLEFGKRY
jgi:hypothetical protein